MSFLTDMIEWMEIIIIILPDMKCAISLIFSTVYLMRENMQIS